MRKYALVTGGSRGIGRAVCIKLARMGYDILINYVSNAAEAQKTLELVRQAGQNGEILMFDVSKREQVTKAIELWENDHPEEYIDVLVNNAGIRRDNVLVFMPEEDWHRVLGITLDGFYNVTQAVLQPMLVHKQGRIINVASVSGLKGQPGQANYSAAKGGLIAVAPGYIETDMTDGLDTAALKNIVPALRFGTPEEVAELVGFLASPQAGYITGEVISINGGLYT